MNRPPLALYLGVLILMPGIARAYDPYQSRQDREYQSLSSSIQRAYSVPSLNYSSAGSYQSSISSGSSYSSSSSSYSAKPSYSGGGSGGGWVDYFPSSRQLQIERMNAQNQTKKLSREEYAAIYAKMEAEGFFKPIETDAQIRERLLNERTHTTEEWASLFAKYNGKTPLNAPQKRARQSREAEFRWFSQEAARNGTRDPWSQMRAGQLCFAFAAADAQPNRAFSFFSKSNPAWPEVQYGLGACYLRGFGVVANPEKARELLERAAMTTAAMQPDEWYSGFADITEDSIYWANRELGVAYELGNGQPKNPILALKWYQNALKRSLYSNAYNEMTLLVDGFWKRNLTAIPTLIEASYHDPELRWYKPAILRALIASEDAKTLYAVGEKLDARDESGREIDGRQFDTSGYFGETVSGHGGLKFFMAAAKLGHEEAARAFFSPSKAGQYTIQLNPRDSYYHQEADFAKKDWPQWEAKFKAAVQNGDASAAIPLAFTYSGAMGNEANPAQAKFYAAKMPADMPVTQRKTVMNAINSAPQREMDNWLQTIWPRFGATQQNINLEALGTPAEPEKATKLREEGNQLAETDLLAARDKWVQAAALGDLTAQARLYFYTASKRPSYSPYIGYAYHDSLRGRLEKLALPEDTIVNNNGAARVVLEILKEDYGTKKAKAPAKTAFQQAASNNAISDEAFDKLRLAAVAESNGWKRAAKEWGFENSIRDWQMAELTLSPAELGESNGYRQVLVALRNASKRLENQLTTLETAIGSLKPRDPISDARYYQGMESLWGRDSFGDGENGDGTSPRDYPRAIDRFSESAGLGHPLAPMAIAYFYGSGISGFPKNSEMSRRWRALSDQRLTTLAASGNEWAQVTLGVKLTTNRPRSDGTDEGDIDNYEWLPLDKARGMKWLQTAALSGAFIPEGFGMDSGQTTAWLVNQVYYGWKRPAEQEKWKQIEKLFEPTLMGGRFKPAQLKQVQVKARAILAAK